MLGSLWSGLAWGLPPGTSPHLGSSGHWELPLGQCQPRPWLVTGSQQHSAGAAPALFYRRANWSPEGAEDLPRGALQGGGRASFLLPPSYRSSQTGRGSGPEPEGGRALGSLESVRGSAPGPRYTVGTHCALTQPHPALPTGPNTRASTVWASGSVSACATCRPAPPAAPPSATSSAAALMPCFTRASCTRGCPWSTTVSPATHGTWKPPGRGLGA